MPGLKYFPKNCSIANRTIASCPSHDNPAQNHLSPELLHRRFCRRYPLVRRSSATASPRARPIADSCSSQSPAAILSHCHYPFSSTSAQLMGRSKSAWQPPLVRSFLLCPALQDGEHTVHKSLFRQLGWHYAYHCRSRRPTSPLGN